jgi:hypothetical protein
VLRNGTLVLQVQRVEIRRKGVVVVAHGRLARHTESASVVVDRAVAGREQLLLLPLRERPLSGKPWIGDNRLAPAAVFVAISTSVSTPACCVTACLGILLEFVSFPTKSVRGGA